MKYKKYLILVFVAFIFVGNLLFSAAVVFATSHEPPVVTPPAPVTTPPPVVNPPAPVNSPVLLLNPLKVNTIAELLELILQIVTIFALPIIVFFIIYSGFLFVTAQGKPDQITKARNALLWSVVGGVIILGANLLLAVIQGTVQSLLR